MKSCFLAVLAATFTLAFTAEAGAAETLASAIGNCSAQTDDKLRLACYDQVAAQLKAAAAAQPPAQVAAQPPKQESAWYDVGGWFGGSSSTAQQTTPSEFGSENLPRQAAVAPAAPAATATPATPAAAPAPAPTQTAAQPQKQEGAWYDVGGWFGGTTPKPPQQQTTAADFGSENLPAPPAAPGMAPPEPLEEITAEVTDVAINFYGRFIVTLDNGQMWRQTDSDTERARFSKSGKNKVVISRGLLGSYNLVIEGRTAMFKVKRIR
jgi:hypothetical protein